MTQSDVKLISRYCVPKADNVVGTVPQWLGDDGLNVLGDDATATLRQNVLAVHRDALERIKGQTPSAACPFVVSPNGTLLELMRYEWVSGDLLMVAPDGPVFKMHILLTLLCCNWEANNVAEVVVRKWNSARCIRIEGSEFEREFFPMLLQLHATSCQIMNWVGVSPAGARRPDDTCLVETVRLNAAVVGVVQQWVNTEIVDFTSVFKVLFLSPTRQLLLRAMRRRIVTSRLPLRYQVLLQMDGDWLHNTGQIMRSSTWDFGLQWNQKEECLFSLESNRTRFQFWSPVGNFKQSTMMIRRGAGQVVSLNDSVGALVRRSADVFVTLRKTAVWIREELRWSPPVNGRDTLDSLLFRIVHSCVNKWAMAVDKLPFLQLDGRAARLHLCGFDEMSQRSAWSPLMLTRSTVGGIAFAHYHLKRYLATLVVSSVDQSRRSMQLPGAVSAFLREGID